jgi:hypothetical protein
VDNSDTKPMISFVKFASLFVLLGIHASNVNAFAPAALQPPKSDVGLRVNIGISPMTPFSGRRLSSNRLYAEKTGPIKIIIAGAP